MILTVCPNTALDKIFFIEKWTHGIPMRTNKTIACVGGKGLNSSVVLSQLEIESIALGFFQGKVGQELIDLLNDYGVNLDPVWVGGTNRISYVIAEELTNIHSHIIVGEVEITPKQSKEFIEKFTFHLSKADYIIFAGTLPQSLPDNFYYTMIEIANKRKIPVLIDTQKQYMLEAIKAKPNIVKMNWEEFGWTFSYEVKTLEALVIQAAEIKKSCDLENLIITLGKDGILALTNEGDFIAKAPVQKSVNAAGAGDSVSAVLAWRLIEGDNWKSALLWSGAVSAAAVLTPRTGDIHMEDVKRIMKDVQVDQIG
jgi:1-phosphofructokinase family hexose kinase